MTKNVGKVKNGLKEGEESVRFRKGIHPWGSKTMSLARERDGQQEHVAVLKEQLRICQTVKEIISLSKAQEGKQRSKGITRWRRGSPSWCQEQNADGEGEEVNGRPLNIMVPVQEANWWKFLVYNH